MNWNQLYASAIPEERFELLALMFRVIEARQGKLILSHGRLIHERRGVGRGAHFINRRRRFIPRPVYLGSFMFTLTAVSIGVWISFFYLPPVYAAPLMLFHLIALSAILIIKPHHWQITYKPHFSLS